MTCPAAGRLDAKALRVARSVAREHMAGGALAAVLTGSHARGDAHAGSDIDIIVLRRESRTANAELTSRRIGGFLVVTAAETPQAVRAAFRTPARLGTHVPGWREAIILADPDGVAGRIQHAANRWSWDAVSTLCDAHVAEEITGYAEEVHKLVGGLGQRHATQAAVQRSVIALRMASIVAIHHRLLWGTENVLWDLAAARMGRKWAHAQAGALGTRRVSHEEGCRAAMSLYAMTAEMVTPLLDRHQRAVVDHARSLCDAP
jgi:hypothetical protein